MIKCTLIIFFAFYLLMTKPNLDALKMAWMDILSFYLITKMVASKLNSLLFYNLIDMLCIF